MKDMIGDIGMSGNVEAYLYILYRQVFFCAVCSLFLYLRKNTHKHTRRHIFRCSRYIYKRKTRYINVYIYKQIIPERCIYVHGYATHMRDTVWLGPPSPIHGIHQVVVVVLLLLLWWLWWCWRSRLWWRWLWWWWSSSRSTEHPNL